MRPVLGVTEFLVQHIHHIQQHVEANQVRQSQWAHRVVCTELHGLINILGRSQTFGENTNRLIHHRHQNSIHDEPRRFSDLYRFLIDVSSHRQHLINSILRRGNAPNHLNQLHDRRRIKEMHAQYLCRTLGSTCDFGNGK